MGALVVLAGFAALGGLVMVLAGAAGLREARRIRARGAHAWALARRPGGGSGDGLDQGGRAGGGAGTSGGGSADVRPLLQFETADGRVMEIVSPVPPTRRRPLADGERVLVTYDPDDPRSVLVHRRERAALDWAFVAAGVLLLAVAVCVVVFGG